MKIQFTKNQLALAAVATAGAAGLLGIPSAASAGGKPAGTYVTGDFHNHTTCSDGSISMQKLVKKATDTQDTPWGLDWFVQAGHGGNGNRNCTLAEDESLGTPAYPYTGQAPTTTWTATIGAANLKGLNGGVGGNGNMWRWQSIQEYQYPILEYLARLRDLPLFIGVESVSAGHEHVSTSVITGQMPKSIDQAKLPTTPGYTPLGNATAMAQWEYCFDRADADTGRGNTVVGGTVGNNWNCSVPGSLNAADPSWNATAQKLMPASGAGTGTRGHAKTVEAMKWMAQFHPNGSYYVPSHLERAGPFNPDGNNGFNIEHLRDFNNAAPKSAFGFETQPGHHASSDRGEYFPKRNNIGGVLVDSVGGTTYGGTGVYGAQVGGVWDALLGEGRNYWFFASSDWHNRGMFGPDDRRSTQDFLPGEYQRDFVMVRNGKGNGQAEGHEKNGKDDLTPQSIVDGLRSGNSFTTTGQLIDRLAFVACASYPRGRSTPALDAGGNAVVEGLAFAAALQNTDVDRDECATMGEKLVVRPGAEIIVSVVVRDPSGTNYSPYSFPNPSLAQIGIKQPLNKPVLDHIDVIRGMVTGYRNPADPSQYAGEWPRDWLTNPNLANVPAAAKNTTAAVIKTFNSANWKTAPGDFRRMVFRLPGTVTTSQYLRLRGTNMPPSVPHETDANGNPLPDLATNASNVANLMIPCNDAACPDHLAVNNGQKYVSYDVAAWSDLWFYSNPIYIEVRGGVTVAGVK
ncbi:hypothetical protein VAR608DRAFT_2068 [Variovorax sp. HW608]|uniref:hypothetical protein n=1 Tax=Variovorax sp. HW608 TaxID=1034889 RepID=UPI0008200690|nr:hypothetical protein [Variovorax sp. HW608]SCK25610.1 hypothetical protein VAR608DRAFT_2068 [Variovorax sp. HW608]